MEYRTNPSHVRLVSVAQIAVGVGILVFWLLFHTVGMAPARPPPCYYTFENAFLPPDTILALALIVSGHNILNADTWGRAVALVCAGGLLFLGVIDFSFNVQNGMYSGALKDSIQAAVIPIVCVATGLAIFRVHGGVMNRRSIAGP